MSGLTGGTGDINPQWFKLNIAGPTITTMASSRVALPVQRLANKRKAMIMEALRVKYMVRAGSGTAAHSKFGVSTLAPPTGSPDFSLGYIISGLHMPMAKLGEYGRVEEDLTDNQGHGVCIATDFLYPFIYPGAANDAVDIWILYRWKNVDLEEYSGILQAQSN